MFGIAVGTWAIIAVWVILHDQVLVAYAPEHFTVGHPPIPGVEAAWALHGEGWYPEGGPARLVVTQSVQLTAYVVGAVGAGASLVGVAARRALRS